MATTNPPQRPPATSITPKRSSARSPRSSRTFRLVGAVAWRAGHWEIAPRRGGTRGPNDPLLRRSLALTAEPIPACVGLTGT